MKSEATGNLQVALQHAVDLLHQDAKIAAQQAEEILRIFPNADPAKIIMAASYRLQGQPGEALAILGPMAPNYANSASFLYEYSLCLGAVGRGDDAIRNLRKTLKLDPKHANAWRALGDQLSVAGDNESSEEAYRKHLALATRHPELIQAAEYLRDGKVAKAELLTRGILKQHPNDASAIRLLADIGIRVHEYEDAQNLLERCLQLAPDFQLARHNYVIVLTHREKLAEALIEVEKLLAVEPNNPNYLLSQGTVLTRKGDHDQALEVFEKVLKNYPDAARAHMNYGHTLKTVGRLEHAISAYRTAIDLGPRTGEAYWSLANLKTFRFSDEDIAAMRSQISEQGEANDQAHIAFALGKALEDRKQFDESFTHYARGNAIRRVHHPYDPTVNVYESVRQVRFFNADFWANLEGTGSGASDPIFIVGLPRSGSTLVEQILASHSLVDGTAELPDITAISRQLGGRSRRNPASDYPECLAKMSPKHFKELGEGYLQSTRIRRGNSPFFTDKMPNNFQHIGLIHLILPNAKIIDARRHPMACCFSCFKQLFAKGQTFTYDLEDMGRYYLDYVKLMDHWDDVLPGKVLRVQYEDMVVNTEAEIRRILEYCGLSFEEQCLRFYENRRAVRTPSSEQVRQPVYRQGLDQWRNYESNLDSLKKVLGSLLERYPIE